MIPFIKTYFIIFSLILGSSNLSKKNDSDKDWELKKYENGIAVYTRNAEDSKFKELRSITTIKTTLSSIVALLNDWESYPEWVYRCGKSSTLKRISDKEVIHYQTVVAPWPVESRDFVVNVKLEQNEKNKIVSIKSTCMHDYIPAIPKHVRIQQFKASWTLIPLKDGTIQVVYQLLVDPGGNVPAWLVNLAVVDGPYETNLNLKKRVLFEKYQKAKVDYIK